MAEEMDIQIKRARYQLSRSEMIKQVKEIEEDGRWNGCTGGAVWIRLADGYAVYRLGASKILLYIAEGAYEVKVNNNKSTIDIVSTLAQVNTIRELIEKVSQ